MRRRGSGLWARLSAVAIVASAAFALALPGVAHADEYLVTVTDDELDAPADCPADGRGTDCSLREAVAAANARAGFDDVVVPKGTYNLSLGEIALTGDPIDIEGAGTDQTIVDGGGTARILSTVVRTGIADLTLRHGHDANGGAGIISSGDLTIERSALLDNDVGPTSGGGAAVQEFNGPLTIVDSEIAGNTTTNTNSSSSGAVFGGSVAAIGTGSELEMRGTTVRDNHAEGSFVFGGVVFADDGVPATISRTTFSGNTTVGSIQGGALFAGGTGRVSASTFAGNVSQVRQTGDQLFGSAAQVANSGSLVINNSTISGNQNKADPADSSAVASGALATFGQPLTVRESTLSGNSSIGPATAFESGSLGGTAAIGIVNTIVAGGSPANCSSSALPVADHSIDSDGSCQVGATNGNQSNVSPLLLPLAANGGPTLTHALAPNSPARDAADLATCLATDQRGVIRPQGAGCDIGAFELEPALPTPAPPTPGPGPVKDRTAPKISLKLGHPALGRALARGLAARIKTNEAAVATISVYVDGANARRVKRAGKARPALVLRVARGSHRFKKRGSARVVARFTAKAKKALRSRSKVRFRVRIVVKDAAGNATRRPQRITLRAAR